jgi:hypothetical protein
MTFEETVQNLPNGFHDSKIRKLSVDFIGRSILISMELLVGLPDTPNPEGYRSGTLKVVAPYLFFVEPPDASYPFTPFGKPVSATGAVVRPGGNPRIDELLQHIPQDATAFVFFLDDWNSYLYIAGGSLEFSWDDEGVLETGRVAQVSTFKNHRRT